MADNADVLSGSIRHWTRGAFITKGGLGDVHMGKNTENGEIFFIKSAPRTPLWSKRLAALQNEAKLLHKLAQCPNVYHVLGSAMSDSVEEFEARPTFDLFLEFDMPRGNLSELVQRCGKLDESVAKSYTLQILQAVSAMHKTGIVHGGINGTNILIVEKGVRLAGLGFAKYFKCKMCSWWQASEVTECSHITIREMIAFPAGFYDDIYAVGCIVCEMVTGQSPTERKSSMDTVIQALEQDLKNMPACMDLIKCCFNPRRISGRWNAKRLLGHPWITKSSSPVSEDEAQATTNIRTPRLASSCGNIRCCQPMDGVTGFSTPRLHRKKTPNQRHRLMRFVTQKE